MDIQTAIISTIWMRAYIELNVSFIIDSNEHGCRFVQDERHPTVYELKL